MTQDNTPNRGCMCQNVEIGSHGVSVLMELPGNMSAQREARIAQGLSPLITVDACLVEEIRGLWAQGIRTTGCCCGHNKEVGFIGVILEDIPRMKALGYVVRPNKSRPGAENSFVPKSIRFPMPPVSVEIEEALRPFANAVFNDNGDMTVTPVYDRKAYVDAYFAHKRLTAPNPSPVQELNWTIDPDAVPPVEGHYRVLIAGDSESVDGYTIYEFGDYEEWAYWTPAKPEEFEDFEGGYKGSWHPQYAEAENVIGFCGPFHVPSRSIKIKLTAPV